MISNNFEDNNNRLAHAAGAGDATEVKRLIPHSDPSSGFNAALGLAAHGGYVECVKLLIPVSNSPTFYEFSSPLIMAVKGGHIECVRLLIPVTEKDWIHVALGVAAELNCIDCAKLLVGACNPKEKKSRPLQLALEHNNEECIELLYDVSDPIAALNTLKENFPNQPEKWSALEQFEAKRLRGVLSNEVGEGAPDRKHKM